VTIGRLLRTPDSLVFEGATGRTLRGDVVFPLTDGVLVMRDSVGFRYVAGEGVRQVALPKGWNPAALQRGNISTTGWMLLEKDTAEEKANPLNTLIGLTKIVTGAPTQEYALFNLADNRMVPLDVSTSGKNVTKMSQCRRKNAVVNVCDKATSYEALWDANGQRNDSHYFWRIDWQQTAAGPVLVAWEHNTVQINAYDLTSGKMVSLFERVLGLNEFVPQLGADGRYRVASRMVLERVSVDDVAQELRSRPAVDTVAAQ
jgi:hypothetical protein